MESFENKKCGCNEKHIKGIKCDVVNCIHHDCDTYCTAGEISVGPRSAYTPGDTLCATFQQKEDI